MATVAVLVHFAVVGAQTVHLSCRHAKAAGMNTSGVISIDPDGSGSEPSFRAYCNQVDHGGGWMLAATRSAATLGAHNTVAASTVLGQ